MKNKQCLIMHLIIVKKYNLKLTKFEDLTKYKYISVFYVVLSPKRPSLCQTRRGLDKGDFYFINIYILNKMGIKICHEYIKNNSYINFGVELTLELSDYVVMQSKHMK